MDNLHIVNLAGYDRPEIVEEKRGDWVNYGTDNNFYQYLIDNYINSTTNNAIINGVSQMIYGKGIDALDSSTKTDEYAALRSIFHDSCLRKIALDLKLLGEASFQVIYNNGKVIQAEHFPRQTLRCEKMSKNGSVEGYYYHPDWVNIKPSEQPKRIAAFGFGNGKESEIKIIKSYTSGYDYYSPVDYQGGLAYCELEEQVAHYLINDVRHSFSGTKVINFSNGLPDREAQLQIKNDIMRKLTGSHGEKVIISFNNNTESKTTIDDIPLNDAPAHYSYLSDECVRKLMVAHRITSPLLLGIRDGNNGLGNNADEIKTASLLFHNTTIRPYQDLIIDCMDAILAVNGISLKLYFKTLQPLEFIETDNAITNEAREEETGVKLSEKVCCSSDDFDDEAVYEQIKDLGQTEEELIEQGWELFDERPLDHENEEALDKALSLASVVPNKATAKSELDGETETGKKYIVRYQYSPLAVSNNSREFCRKMVKAKKIYRKEDLNKESQANKELAATGENSYNIWLHAGGANCKHFFLRKTYIFTDIKPDPNSPKAKPAYKSERNKEGIKEPTKQQEPDRVSQKNSDRKDKGYKN